MNVVRYKPFFSVAVSYELAATGISAEGITVNTTNDTDDKLKNLKLKVQQKKNIATVYYEGQEKPVAAPALCEPLLTIDTEQYFYFSVRFADKEKINGLKFHSSAAVAKETGFPVLYDAAIPSLNGTAAIIVREDVKVASPVFTFTVTAAQTGLTSAYAALEIRDEKNVLVDLKIPPAAINTKSIDGPGAVPEFAFSIDASSLQPGVYELKAGAFKKKFFFPGPMNIQNAVSVIRVVKNNFLEYKKNLNDSSFAKFSLLIPKA